MYRSSPFRSTLNTGYITALDMCEVCTEAVHSVAPWTRVTSQLWTSVKYEPPSDTFVHISTTLTRFYVSRTILRLHFRGAWFGNSTTLPRLYLWHPANSTTLTRAPNQPGARNYHVLIKSIKNLHKTKPTEPGNSKLLARALRYSGCKLGLRSWTVGSTFFGLNTLIWRHGRQPSVLPSQLWLAHMPAPKWSNHLDRTATASSSRKISRAAPVLLESFLSSGSTTGTSARKLEISRIQAFQSFSVAHFDVWSRKIWTDEILAIPYK